VARKLILALACAALAVSAGAASRMARNDEAKQALSYGADPLQAVDYWAGPSSDAPLVVFVHGGGWSRGDKRMMAGSDKLAHWHAQGYAVASVNYRLVPDATVEDEAADVAAAVAYLKAHSGTLGFDPDRIALAGHSAGAHLVALVGTDPVYLRGAGLSFADIDGIIPLDGAAYYIPQQLSEGPPIMGRMYRQAFGGDAERQARLSPITQAVAPNASAFLILHVQRPDGIRQSEALGTALRRAGTSAEVEGFPGTGLRGHAEINRRMGDPDYPATAVVDRFLARVFG
jgi:acetyl esterase/lipase